MEQHLRYRGLRIQTCQPTILCPEDTFKFRKTRVPPHICIKYPYSIGTIQGSDDPNTGIEGRTGSHFDIFLMKTEDTNSHYCCIPDFSFLVPSRVTSYKGEHNIPHVSGLKGAEILAEHRRYCNEHAPVNADMTQPEKNGSLLC
ncbi:hypothetical protein PR048_023372 [Dryococelus australis]|uniref:Uncharacterized protein n=1 Tax=Dryococelus australis TaxID=614101 RepID=A0ABQ9GTW6_9NEOP|nr:hypothetical protein PR048_023372 [Dryococelus australis]